MKFKIAIVQPVFPDYREYFFNTISKKFSIDFYSFHNSDDIQKQNMNKSSISFNVLNTLNLFNLLRIYSITDLIRKQYKILILPAEIRSVSTWLLLLLKKIINKKIILWGHGISVKRYLKEEQRYPLIKRVFHNLADQVWLYTKNEKEILSRHIENQKLINLQNTIDISNILHINSSPSRVKVYKLKYNISTDINLIFCARFSSLLRRADLLIDIVQQLDVTKIGIIIIGDGKYKPDFSPYTHVYEFGQIYDRQIKNELFAIADMYVQPAWIGLSAVEAMAYGKPVLTLRRSDEIKQCVEYNYIENFKNGIIANTTTSLVHIIQSLSEEDILKLQSEAKKFAIESLSIEKMIERTCSSINGLMACE